MAAQSLFHHSRVLLCAAALLVAALVVGCQDTPLPVAPDVGQGAGIAAKKPGGGGGGDNTGCVLAFNVTLTEAGMAVRGDGSPLYQSGVDKVSAGTGNGPGFRFDTNSSGKVEAKSDIRKVTLDFTGTGQENEEAPLKGIDLRFDKQQGGLDLCAMAVGATGTVPLTILFISSVTDSWKVLRYGGVHPSGVDCEGTTASEQAEVTRVTVDQWTISGATACLLDEGAFEAAIAMPLFMTIDNQDPPAPTP